MGFCCEGEGGQPTERDEQQCESERQSDRLGRSHACEMCDWRLQRRPCLGFGLILCFRFNMIVRCSLPWPLSYSTITPDKAREHTTSVCPNGPTGESTARPWSRFHSTPECGAMSCWRCGLAPRYRLITSWGCRQPPRLGCSPIRAAREPGGSYLPWAQQP